VREQTKPGGPFGDWFAWTLDLCDFDAEPEPCPAVSFAPERSDGAVDLGAWDTDCQTAQAVAGASKAIAFDPGPHSDGTGSYRMSSQGFTCSRVLAGRRADDHLELPARHRRRALDGPRALAPPSP
jgi:hypothetical protein